MKDSDKERLKNRVSLCKAQVEFFESQLKGVVHDLNFWKQEFIAAQAELAGFKQGELQLCRSCGD